MNEVFDYINEIGTATIGICAVKKDGKFYLAHKFKLEAVLLTELEEPAYNAVKECEGVNLTLLAKAIADLGLVPMNKIVKSIDKINDTTYETFFGNIDRKSLKTYYSILEALVEVLPKEGETIHFQDGDKERHVFLSGRMFYGHQTGIEYQEDTKDYVRFDIPLYWLAKYAGYKWYLEKEKQQ